MKLYDLWKKAHEINTAIEEHIITHIVNDPEIDRLVREARELARERYPDEEGAQFQMLARAAIRITKGVERTLISKFIR